MLICIKQLKNRFNFYSAELEQSLTLILDGNLQIIFFFISRLLTKQDFCIVIYLIFAFSTSTLCILNKIVEGLSDFPSVIGAVRLAPITAIRVEYNNND